VKAAGKIRPLMKFAEKPLRILLGALLLGTVVNSLAVSLGRLRGVAIVGRPLDVTLTVQLDASEGLSAVCVATDVFFGDSQVSPGKVRMATSAGANAGEALVRIRTTSVVDEPVVTLYAREGCLQASSRKYVMLAEALADNAGPAAWVNVPAVPSVPVAQPPLASGTGNVPGRALVPSAGQAHSSRITRPRKASTAKPDSREAAAPPSLSAPVAPRRADKAVPEPARLARSRLKLDPIDLTIDRDPVLRSSPELLSVPSADAQQRAAAAALWQALNAQPQDMARDSQRLKSLEVDVASMLAQSRKTENAITDLRGQLAQARSERYGNWLVYALSVFLLLSLLAGVSLWVRNRRHRLGLQRGAWWGDEPAGEGKSGTKSGFGAGAESGLQQLGGDALVNTDLPLKAGMDLNLDELDSEIPQGKVPAPPASPASPARSAEPRDHPEFLPSLGGLSGMPRIVNAEELFDVQQQADFFLSLGHTDKAVEVLRHHTMDNVETSALIYLDLLDLYHNLARKEDYEALRKEFHRLFNAQVPAFDDYAMDTHGLEFYVEALTRIESLWPTPKVLDVLEESIFRKPDSRSEVFSLAAYRELLLLHSIAKKIITRPKEREDVRLSGHAGLAAHHGTGALPHARTFGHTDIQPLSARFHNTTPPPLPTEMAVDLKRPPVSSRLGLDIDLSQDDVDAVLPLPSIDVAEPIPDADQGDNLIEFDLDPPALTQKA
jgi:hypothetical protein